MIEEKLNRIEEAKKQMTKLEAERDERLIDLGREAWGLREKAGDPGFFKTSFRNIDRLEAEIAEYSRMVRQIQEAVARKKEIDTHRSALKEEMRSVDGEIRGTYEGIGRAAFGSCRAELFGEKEIITLFEEIRVTEGVLHSAKDEQERLSGESNRERFIKKISEKSRTAFLKTKIRGVEAKLSRLYRRTGKAFCSSGVLKRMEDDSLEGVFAPYRAGIEDIVKLQDKDRELVTDKERVEADLSHLGAGKNEKKRTGELEQRIDQCRLSLRGMYLDTGRMFLENGGKGYEEISEVTEIQNKIGEIEGSITDLNDTITVLETNLQIEGLKTKVVERDKKISSAKERIEKLNAEIKEHQKHKKRLQSEIRHLEKTIEPGETT